MNKERIENQSLLRGGEEDLGVAGDIRANEQTGLLIIHTLLLREHNRLADELAALHPEWTDDELFIEARELLVATIQHITYSEYLPLVLGEAGLPPYGGHDASVDAHVSNAFAAAAFRFAHSQIAATVLARDAFGASTSLPLKETFFRPDLVRELGFAPLLRGLVHQRAEAVDPMIVDDLRNFLFGVPGYGGLDLAAIDIQRGRDHGLPSYVAARTALDLSVPVSIDAVSSDPTWTARLEEAYGSIETVDLWAGGLAEDAVRGGVVGSLFAEIIRDQFQRIRVADPSWYEASLAEESLTRVRATTMAELVRRNSGVVVDGPAFVAPE